MFLRVVLFTLERILALSKLKGPGLALHQALQSTVDAHMCCCPGGTTLSNPTRPDNNTAWPKKSGTSFIGRPIDSPWNHVGRAFQQAR